MSESETSTRVLWALKFDDSDGFVRAIDSTGDPCLFYLTLKDAQEAAEYHLEEFDVPCTPIRLR